MEGGVICSTVARFANAGGVPLGVLLDSRKTVVVRYEERRPMRNGTLADGDRLRLYGGSVHAAAAAAEGAVENRVVS